MTRLALGCVFAICELLCLPALASTVVSGYQDENGAITVVRGGEIVDPYFASKALLAARDADADTQRAATAWINWLLPFQRADGRFDRLCKQRGAFTACAAADADDALLAVWIELLVRSAPSTGLPLEWRSSLSKAFSYLSSLYDKHNRIFHVSKELPVGLLMDNVEVYSAFKAIGEYFALRGEDAEANIWKKRQDYLARGIFKVFWSAETGFRVSTQDHTEHGFYPDAVAQIFPLLVDLRAPNWDASASYQLWMKQYRETWLGQAPTDYPWGLIALIAYKMGDSPTVLCWRARAQPFRHGAHWNVLEEALYVALSARFPEKTLLAPACGAI
jgi:hypothetical protein